MRARAEVNVRTKVEVTVSGAMAMGGTGVKGEVRHCGDLSMTGGVSAGKVIGDGGVFGIVVTCSCESARRAWRVPASEARRMDEVEGEGEAQHFGDSTVTEGVLAGNGGENRGGAGFTSCSSRARRD